MKLNLLKKVAVIAACALAAVSSYATTTGDVIFRTSGGASGFGKVFNVDVTTPLSGAPLSGTGFSAQIWGSLTSNNSANFVLLDPLSAGAQTFATGAAAGFVGVGGTFSPSPQDYVVPNSSAGNTFFYEVRAWDNSTGNSYATATVKGKSGVAQVTLGGIDANDNIVTPPNANNFGNFSLVAAVPEPSVLALGMMGGLVLVFRRRK